MNKLQQLSDEFKLQENEVLIFQPIEELYHPIAWLASIGEFLGNEASTKAEISLGGRSSVHYEINS